MQSTKISPNSPLGLNANKVIYQLKLLCLFLWQDIVQAVSPKFESFEELWHPFSGKEELIFHEEQLFKNMN